MNLVDSADQLDFIERVKEFKTWFTEEWKKRNKGVPLHFQEPDDPTFIGLFDKLSLEDPDWVLMLQYVEGGKEWIQRYMRLTNQIGFGIDWRAFCTEHAKRCAALKAQQAMTAMMGTSRMKPIMPSQAVPNREVV